MTIIPNGYTRIGSVMTPRRGREGVGHRHVVGFGRQLLDQLVVAHHGDQPRVRVSAGSDRS